MGRLQDELTPEYLLKYLKREADLAKMKLSQEKRRIGSIKAFNATLLKENEELKEEVERLKKRNAELTSCLAKDTTASPIYKALQERYVRCKRDKTTLLLQLAKYETGKDNG